MLLKRNKLRGSRRNEDKEQSSHNEHNEYYEREQSEQEQNQEQKERHESNSEQNQEQNQEQNEQEQNEQEQNEQNEQERHINLKSTKQQQKSNNISDIINLYYDTISEKERELSHLKRERKNMKITYINKYLNNGSKLTSDENVKRQELKKQLLNNGESIANIKTTLTKLKDDLIANLGSIDEVN